jgi:phospholipase C
MSVKCLRLFAGCLAILALAAASPARLWAHHDDADDFPTTTPIKHVIVIFDENISFDHYFATYPFATNPAGETAFYGKHETPRSNNLLSGGLLDENPNSTKPFRLDPLVGNVTCDQNHSYTPEQAAFDHGLMDMFPEKTGSGNSASSPCYDAGKGTGVVMGYYDGNTVTAIWNYAQHFALNDNSFSTMFGPSAPGAVNLVAGTTANGTASATSPNGATISSYAGTVAGGGANGTMLGDARPMFDDCTFSTSGLAKTTPLSFPSTNLNVGNLLSTKGVTWGWFQGGFRPTGVNAAGLAVCGTHNVGLAGDDATTQSSDGDYIPHHEPFQFFESTANVHHTAPTRSLIGKDEPGVNHQYDFTNGPGNTFNTDNDFWHALEDGHLPAVSFLKAGAYQDAHPGYSDPLDEQRFVVQVINKLMHSREWDETAIIIAYDDSDGWYDHQMDPIINQSSSATDDVLTGPGFCGTTPATDVPGRCGYGMRQPLLVISPWSKRNYIDHRLTDQSSILRFIEDNWSLGRIGGDSSDVKAGTLNGMFDFDDHHDRAPKLILDPSSGVVVFEGDGN